jgi:cbb3-type cytochrome oxidase maturation protein
MNQLLILIPAALTLGVVAVAAFLWSLRSGQYDDLDGAAERVLNDDAAPKMQTLGNPDRDINSAQT